MIRRIRGIRFWAVLLCLAMFFTALPWIPGAGGHSYAATTVNAGTEQEFRDALKAVNTAGGGTIHLTADLRISSPISYTFSNLSTLTIEGHGYQIMSMDSIAGEAVINPYMITLNLYTGMGNNAAVNVNDVAFTARSQPGRSLGLRIMGDGISSIDVSQCTFSNFASTNSSNGTALCLDELGNTTKINVTLCRFHNNHGTTNSPAGGTLYIRNGNAVVDGCTFENNIAHSGAGFYAAYGVVTVRNSTFSNNTAGYRGGAIHSHGTVFVDSSNTFGSNTSDQYGGQIYVSFNDTHAGRVVLDHVQLTGGLAGDIGGGIFVAAGAELYLKNGTTITGNLSAETDSAGNQVTSNVYVAGTEAKIYVLDAMSDTATEGIGVSTSNPYTLKELVLSATQEAVNGVNEDLSWHQVTGQNLAAYNINTDTSTYTKFVYDSEYWLLVEDNNDAVEEVGGTKQDGNKMLLVLNASAGVQTANLILDMNLPEQDATVLHPAIGSVVEISDPSQTIYTFESSGGTTVTYTFLGWYTLPDGGERVTSVEIPAGDTVLYAHWRMSIDEEGGSGGSEIDGRIYAIVFRDNYEGGGVTTVYKIIGTFETTVTVAGEPVTIQFHFPEVWPNDPYRPGYTFLGWSTSPTNGIVEYTKEDPLPHEDITLYGVWQPNEYTITWDANGGQYTTTNTQYYAEVVDPPLNNPTRTGYSFGGWYMDQNGNQEILSDLKVSGDQTFYAKWIPDRVIVNWVDTRYGTASMTTTELSYNDYLTVIGNLTGTDGYTFDGWYTEPNGEGTKADDTIILNEASGILTQHTSSEDGVADHGYWETTFYSNWIENTKTYTAYIVWNDEKDNDRVRPDYVNINLYSTQTHEFVDETPVTVTVNDRVAAGQTVRIGDETFSSDDYDIWSYTFTGLSISDIDQTTSVGYRLHMTSYGMIPEGAYSHEIDTSTSNNYGTILFEHALIETNVTVSVTWDDGNNHDGVRPDAVLISLYRDNREGEELVSGSEIILTGGDNVWYYTYTNLQKYETNGQEIIYQLKVEPVSTGDFDDYPDWCYLTDTAAYFGHEDELTNITTNIHWEDDTNRDGERPQAVELQLYNSSGEMVGDAYRQNITGDLDNDIPWTYTWTDVKRYQEDGSDEVYTVKVVNLDAINSYIRNELNHADSSGYAATIDQMDVYMVHETVVQEMEAVVNWIDEDNNDGVRPDDIIVQLYANGEAMEEADFRVTLSGSAEENQWKYRFENLPKYTSGEQGKEIIYTIQVKETKEGNLYGEYILTGNAQNQRKVLYKAEYDTSRPIVYLTHEMDTITKTLSASWVDDNNNDGIRPTEIVAGMVQKVGEETSAVVQNNLAVTRTLNSSNNYSVSVTGLPKYQDGQEVEYSASLIDPASGVEGYTMSVNNTILVFRHTSESGAVSAKMIWNDENNNDGIRPVAVTAELYKDGVPTGDVRTLTAENAWTIVWNGLESKQDGQPVHYSVKVDAPQGYTESYQPETTATSGQIDITLTHEIETVSKTAVLYWNDNENVDQLRPSELAVQLYADGTLVAGKQVTVTGEGNQWQYEYTDLPKYQNGQEIDYTVHVADNLADQYTAVTAGMNLYLNHDQKTGTITVRLSFSDDRNADGDRPANFHLQLMSKAGEDHEYSAVEGEDYDIVVTEDTYELEIPGLPVYAGDGNILYTVAATALDGGTDYICTATTDVSLTNTTNSKPVYVVFSNETSTMIESGTIYWYDNKNQYGGRPEELTLNLYANGVFKRTVTVTGDPAADTWEYSVSDLAKNEGGNPIVYTVTVDTAPLGDAYPSVHDGTSMNVSLTHRDYGTVNKISRTVELIWADNENAWSTRPDTINLTLLANGSDYQVVTLSARYVDEKDSDIWSYTWDGSLPTHLNGEPVEYSILAEDLTMYTPEVISNTNGWTIRMQQSFGIDFTLNWEDAQNDDDKRPDDITLHILADGKNVQSVVFTGEPDADFWTAHFSDLPVWRSHANTAEQIEYTFEYASEDQEYLTDNFYTSEEIEDSELFYEFNGVSRDTIDLDTAEYRWNSTLVREKEVKTVTGEIIWEDDMDRDGTRPDEIFVQLYADGIAKEEPVRVTGSGEENTWSVSWEEQEVYEQLGTEIIYTMELSGAVDGYELSYITVNDSMTFTLIHHPETADVTSTIYWNDESNVDGIGRVPVTLQWRMNGEPYGDPVSLTPENYPEGETEWIITLPDEYIYYNHGEENVFTFSISSDELNDLLNDGYTLSYNYEDIRNPNVTVSETYFDVSGTVYFQYNHDPSYVTESVSVTAFLHQDDGTYIAVGAAQTDSNGQYQIKNIPQGDILVRATWNYNDYMLAGRAETTISDHDRTDVDVTLSYDAANDQEQFTYNASGKAYYQTNRNDESTKYPIRNGTVLLYRVSGEQDTEYVDMTMTDTDGNYTFAGLPDGSYYVVVLFEYEGQTYVYDHSDALSEALSFYVSYADAEWPDIIKQLNLSTETVDPGEPELQEPVHPQPCVAVGQAYYEDDAGNHTKDPIEGVDMYIRAENGRILASATTEGDGSCSVEGLNPGTYTAIFTLEGYTSRIMTFEITEADFENGAYRIQPVYFTRSHMEQSRTGRINGTVLDEETGYPYDVMVSVYDTERNLITCSYADANGYYDFYVDPGTYIVEYVRIQTNVVESPEGWPMNDHTELSSYQITGNTLPNAMVALYREDQIVASTTSDKDGNYHFENLSAEEAQYTVRTFSGSDFTQKRITASWHAPIVSSDGNTYTVTGLDTSGEIELLVNESGIWKTFDKNTAVAGTSGWEIGGLREGEYLVRIDGIDSYYFSAPDSVIDSTYLVTVSGTVTEQEQPVRAARVDLIDSSGEVAESQITLSDGQYSFLMPEGSYRLVITYPTDGEIIDQKSTAETDSLGNAYPSGLGQGDVWTYNIGAARMAGTVVDSNGKAVENATVVITSQNTVADDGTHITYTIQTREDGTWSIGVAEDTYHVSAYLQVDEQHIYYAQETYQSVQAPKADLNFIIERYTVDGTIVRYGDEKPVEEAQVTIFYPDSDHIVWSGSTEKDGTFSINLIPGDYRLTITKDDVTREFEVTVDQNKILHYTLNLDFEVTGIVLDTNGNHINNGIVYYRTASGSTLNYAYTDDDGWFTLNLPFGTYAFYAVYGQNRSETETIAVESDTNLELIVGAAPEGTYSISGQVLDNLLQPLENAKVTATYGDGRIEFATVYTDSNGYYTITGLPSNTYHLTASWNGYQTNGEQNVTVAESDLTNVNLTVYSAFGISGMVRDTDGNPVAYAEIYYAEGGQDDFLRISATDAGTFGLDLTEGNYVFYASAATGRGEPMTVIVSQNTPFIELIVPASDSDYEITAEATGNRYEISGIARNPEGEPADGAKVELFDENGTLIKETTSAEDGSWKFEVTETGNYTVKVTIEQVQEMPSVLTGFQITGTAVDENGNPVESAVVELHSLSTDQLVRTTTSDTEGAYEFSNVPEDDYLILIRYTNGTGEIETEQYLTTTENILLPEISENGNEMVTIHGQTDDPAEVFLYNLNGEEIAHSRTDASNEYTFIVPAGNYYLVLDGNRYYFTAASDAPSANPAGNFMISGIVADSEGNPVSGATVQIIGESGTVVTTAKTDENGYYAVNVEKGNYTVEILYSTTHAVDLTVQNAVDYTLNGTVTDKQGNPVSGVTVVITDENGNRYTTATDADGQYEYGPLPPGDYTIAAEIGEKVVEIEITLEGNRVIVDSGQPEDPDPDEPEPTPSPDARILLSGQVRTDHGRPLAGAVVLIKNEDNGKTSRVFSEEDGSWILEEQAAGHYTITAEYQNAKGEINTSTETYMNHHYTEDQTNLNLTIPLYYLADVDQNGSEEPIYAGEDDLLETPDDFYDMELDDQTESVYVGEDGQPGNEDDYYLYPIDGERIPVEIGEDGKPLTSDDHYAYDLDQDGRKEDIKIGEDCRPGTEDDWYAIITFDANGGLIGEETILIIDVMDFVTETVNLPTAVYAGHTFKGWSLQKDSGSALTLDDIKALKESTVLYARWSKAGSGGGSTGGGGNSGGGGASTTYTVTFDSNGGSSVAKQTVASGKRANEPTDPTREGYEFAGWYTDTALTQVYDFSDVVTESFTLYARWNEEGMSQDPNEEPEENENHPGVDVSDVLNTEDHMAYMQGYPDGTFRPTADMTRAEAAQMFYNLLLNRNPGSETISFTDVAADAWYAEAVNALAEIEILTGYEDGTFRPDNTITRAEFAAMAIRFAELADVSGRHSFSDVSTDDWFYTEVETAAEYGWITGYEDGTFRPDQKISRAEVATLVNRVLKRSADQTYVKSHADRLLTFPDVTDDAWYYYIVAETTNTHDYVRTDSEESWIG